MEYKGYSAKIVFDDEAMIFHGEVAGIGDVVTFQGTSAEELIKAFRDSVDDYLEFCAAEGKEPDKPYSGTFIVRGEPDLHRRIAMAAARNHMNANQWVVAALSRQIDAEKDLASTVRTV